MKNQPRLSAATAPAPRASRRRRLSMPAVGGPTARLLVLLLITAGLAGCSNNPYPPGETAKRILYSRLREDPKTLDPSVSYTVSEATIIDVVYSSYYRYHYLKRNPFVLELSLGAAEPKREPYVYTAKEGGRTVTKRGEAWTFRIKQGLRFQDDPCFPGGKGREIKAADFILSFRRMADPAVPCPVLSFFEDKVIGLAEYVAHNRERSKDGKAADPDYPVPGLQLDPKDPHTFRILLNQPYPQLRYVMAMHFTAPLAKEAVDRYGKELARHLVGCGPFMMTEWSRKQRIVLEVNPNRPPEYYPSDGEPGDREAGLLQDAGKQLPLVDKIVINLIRENVTGWNLFLQGYQDAWAVTQENYQQVMSRAGQLSPEMVSHGVKLHRSTDPNIYYMAFNMRDSLVGGYTPEKRKLRQAISTAIDSQAFIDLFSQGNGTPAQWIVPAGIYSYDPNYRNPYRQPNLERAGKLLAEAGYPNGIDPETKEPLTLYYDNAAVTAEGRQDVGLLKKQIEALGVRLVSRTTLPNVWQDRVDKGQFQIIRYGWLADYPDPENFVFLLYGPNRRPGPNSSAYDNPEYNRLFEQMRSMEDGPERLAIIRRMREIAVEDCPWVFMQHDQDLILSYDWIQNVKPHPITNDGSKYRSVDGSRRARLQAEWNGPNYWPAVVLAAALIAGSIPAAQTVRARSRRKARRGSG